MYEAQATVIGTVVTHPVRRDLANGEQVVTFRMASNARRFDAAAGEWVDNGTYRGKDGTERRDLEMRAVAVGPDLGRCSASVVRRSDAARSASHTVRNISDRRGAVPPIPAQDAAEYAPTVPTAVASTTAADSLPARSPVAVPISGTPERVDA